MSKIDENRLEQEIASLGGSIFEELNTHQRSRLDPQFYTDRLMEYAMQDEELKVSLFRFVDVLPSLHSASSVIKHVHEYFEPISDRIPGFLQKGFKVSPDSLTSVMAARAIKQQVRFIADRFIVGESPDKAMSTLRKIRKSGLAFTVDLVGEAALGEQECQQYTNKYLDLIEKLGTATKKWSESAAIIPGHKAECTPIHISVKLSALYSQAKPLSTEKTIDVFQEKLTEILVAAKKVGAYVFVDMEDSALVTPTLEAFKRTLSHPVFKDYSRCGIVLQAYLRRTEDDFENLLQWLKQRGVPIGIRLVKGAYWDTETIMARQKLWPIPVWQSKSCSDAVYERLSKRLLDETELIVPAFGSHNVRSLVHACAYAKLSDIALTDFELQSLYGMAPEIKKAFSNRGYLVREYSPVGELIPGMGYLVRRLLENTSNEGFLRRSTFEKASAQSLLKTPHFNPDDTGDQHLGIVNGEFRNEPFTDYTIDANRAEITRELNKIQSSAPTVVKPIVAGIEIDTIESIQSISPQDSEAILAKIHLANKDIANNAIEQLRNFFPSWRDTPIEERTEVLFKAAAKMRERKSELISVITHECAKPIAEADADVAEAIDFCEYYARQALKILNPQQLPSPPGELNSLWYEARGITAVISPWNFPLAIPCGMFSASLVCGNCVILKPAEQSSLIASIMFEIFLSAGMPSEAAAFLPGYGEEIGELLGSHPQIDTVCFTGSKTVGLSLIENGAKTDSLGRHVRKVVAEMGGKNAIVVDEDADLDEAVKGSIYSAFGFAGQKCSACSIIYVVGSAYERFCERFKDALLSLDVGPATSLSTFIGPVIDKEACTRLRDVISSAKNDCKLLAEHPFNYSNATNGYYVTPTAFIDVPNDHILRQKELFGPVVIVDFASSFDEAICNAQNTEYALTGAVFSRSPKNIKYSIRHFRVGNLYINSGSTGALVARQPFGGAAMSGVGSKAGGPQYLFQFLLPRTASENTLRRGFAPL